MPTPPTGMNVHDLLTGLLAGQPIPRPHATGSHPLWTDPHISRSMLRAHLDPEQDAASRRPEAIDACVAWLAGQLPAGARVLDLGCGPGLYAERLARAGFEVTGVDFSAGSLEYARRHTGGVRYLLGDYRDIVLDETFDAVLLIYLDLGALCPADAGVVLGRVRRWLAPDGVFFCDLATARQRTGSEDRRDWGVATEGFWADRPHAWLARTLRYPGDPEHPGCPTYLDEYVVVTADESRVYRVWERCFTPEAVRAEFGRAGLSLRSVYGDLAGSPYLPDASPVLGLAATPC